MIYYVQHHNIELLLDLVLQLFVPLLHFLLLLQLLKLLHHLPPLIVYLLKRLLLLITLKMRPKKMQLPVEKWNGYV